jgi:uncharacterized protein (TIGR02391 family)
MKVKKQQLIDDFEKLLNESEAYKQLLLSSTNSVMDVVNNIDKLNNFRKLLISHEAKLAEALAKLSRQPTFKDQYHGVIYSAYDNAFTNDVVVRSARSLDAVIEDLVYIIARLKSLSNDEYKNIFPDANKSKTTKDVTFDFWTLVHPEIKNLSETRYNSGNYADSVEAAFKHINSRVKSLHKSKTKNELDGSTLMKKAFSVTNPTLVIQDLDTDSGKSMQIGYMEILSGSMTGIRNPKAHDNIIITNVEAQRFLIMASLLMYKVDNAS